jgi:single-stranded DNA-binding protein
MTIDCAFYGFLAADAEPRTSQAGKPWVRLSVGVGKDDAVQWVQVAVFGKAAETATNLKKGDRCYIEGSIKINYWTSSQGADRHGLSVAAFKCEQTHRIGRNKPDRKKKNGEAEPAPARELGTKSGAAFDDEIPF